MSQNCHQVLLTISSEYIKILALNVNIISIDWKEIEGCLSVVNKLYSYASAYVFMGQVNLGFYQ